MAERGLCKPEVRGSNPLASTKLSCDFGIKKVVRAMQPARRVMQLMLTRQIGWSEPPEVEHSKTVRVGLQVEC